MIVVPCQGTPDQNKHYKSPIGDKYISFFKSNKIICHHVVSFYIFAQILNVEMKGIQIEPLKTKVNYPAIGLFYIIAIALRYLTNKTSLLEGFTNGFLKIILQGAGPAIGAWVVFLLFKIKHKPSLRGNYNTISSPLLLYWGLPITLILGVEYAVKGTFSFVAILAVLVYGLLEEIGWRGFLQQELKPLPEFLNILLVATLWFTWHLNFEVTTSNALFFGILIVGTWGIGKVADTTHSLLAASAFHSVNNFFTETDTLKITILATLVTIWVISSIYRKKQLKKNQYKHNDASVSQY
ncbi:CPBP family intramembrane glutamic endopeptidase [Flavobacterium subsaxonicum]|uniref:CPBP family intramembrane glutamic endopeptidase n=1 Tax=Flavobacterium subsaxonicum TaxID=426226 RepID=UPI001A94BE9C|nr:CPBP family intramembrane glutamic endopeptidase [Flavobacterium subsaxonicum]